MLANAFVADGEDANEPSSLPAERVSIQFRLADLNRRPQIGSVGQIKRAVSIGGQIGIRYHSTVARCSD